MIIKDYLKSIQQNIIEEKIELDKKSVDINNHIKENDRFIQLLEEKDDSNFESFSPREVNHKTKEKVCLLKEEQKKLQALLKKNEGKISENNYKNNELLSIMKYMLESEKSKHKNNDILEQNEKNIYLKILEAQECERQKIAKILYDSSIENLLAINHRVELCSKILDVDIVRCKLELANIKKITNDLVDNTKKIVYDLKPILNNNSNLNDLLNDLFIKIKKENSINILYKVSGNIVILDSIITITIFKIIKDAIDNCISYAKAEKISVKLIYKENSLNISVKDNGIGFQISNDKYPLNSGLNRIRERTYLLSGKVYINSIINKGTTIEINLPITKKT